MDWAHKIKITIDHTKIDELLFNFPVMLHLNFSRLFTILGSNSKKIAVTTDNSTTQCYVEIESWYPATNNAWLWINVPYVSSVDDTVLYLYYDNSKADNVAYVGNIGSTVAQNVWDSNFVGVWHMSQDPSGAGACVLDSTGTYNGTPEASMTSADLIDGKIGKALNFDGTDDYINLDAISMDSWTTMSAWIKISTTSQATAIAGHLGDARWNNYGKGLQYENGKVYAMGESNNNHAKLEAVVNDTNWHYIAGIFTSSGKLYVDGVQQDSGNISSGTAYAFAIAASRRSGENARNFNGSIDEVRLSDNTRSAAWIKATHYSNCDNLVTYSSFTGYFSGYVFEKGAPVSRFIKLHDRTDGSLMSITTSSGNGYYYLETISSGSHYIVCLDDVAGIEYNDLIIGSAIPTTVSG